VRALIVTADDVGLHPAMTLGAVHAHHEGIVTACSVAGAGAALDHAALALRRCPHLDVGVHLMLTGARPVADPGRVPGLTTRRGTFLKGPREFVARWTCGRIAPGEVEIELRAQIERVIGAGLAPCHLNGHQHLHVLPGVFGVVVRLALEYRIPYVRIPDDRPRSAVFRPRQMAVLGLGRLARRAARQARGAGLRVNDRTIGVMQAGHLGPATLERLVDAVEGTTELVAHPGVDDAALGRQYRWGYQWEAETSALCDPAIARRLGAAGIHLVGVRERVGKAPRQEPDPARSALSAP
jgi:predicted glycoside hydrolase/deacetylase ChbG (UPF0249 family)